MKTLIIPALALAFVCLSLSSCVIHTRHDNGRHAGWTKNPNNPHHPATTNPGHTKSSSPAVTKSKGNSGKKK